MMPRPTSVEPVNETLATPGCLTRPPPTSAPPPGMTLSTPGGRPASVASSANLSAVKGVLEAGFRMTVLPQARAGAIFHRAWMMGKFHGVMAATTPIGSRRV